MKVTKLVFILSALSLTGRVAAAPPEQNSYGRQAREVSEYIQKSFWNPSTGLYATSKTNRTPDFMWPNGVMFSALAAASRHEPNVYQPIMLKFFTAMNAYWDATDTVPGYKPSTTSKGGSDKYYDDNAWMVITYLEAYESTRDVRYLTRADETLKYVLSGWDEQIGGGIWWYGNHTNGTKNTCANAPAAVGCLRLAKFSKPQTAKQLIEKAQKIIDWTVSALQSEDGRFEDRKVVATGKVIKSKLTYNSALMLRAFLGMYRLTGKQDQLNEAQRIAKAADLFIDKKTGAYRDHVKWSHLMVEADLELYRITKEDYLIQRARNNANFYYNTWKANPPADLMTNASIARLLWLLADTETDAGRVFWDSADKTGEKENSPIVD